MISDALRFLLYNAQHYALALWGLRLRVDPPYPLVRKFFPGLIADSVFEYRSYGALAIWAGLLVAILPAPMVSALALIWYFQTIHRCQFYKSALAFWGRASKENPFPHRAHARYVEQLIREAERLEKAGGSGQDCQQRAAKLIDRICAAGKVEDPYMPPQGPEKWGFKATRPKN